MQDRFPKSDWRLFRTKLAGWQESYMDRLNKEYIELLSGDGEPSEKFWELAKRIRVDKQKPGVKLQLSRTDFFYLVISLINDGVIGFEDLEDFSDELKDAVKCFIERQSWDCSYDEE